MTITYTTYMPLSQPYAFPYPRQPYAESFVYDFTASLFLYSFFASIYTPKKVLFKKFLCFNFIKRVLSYIYSLGPYFFP